MGQLSVYDCGTLGYVDALKLQRSLQAARERELIGDTLLLLEHPPVITMGKSAIREHVLATDAELASEGATVEWIERGGETTYHGPGQRVVYVMLDLNRFVRNMEQVFVDLLAREYGIEAGRDPEHPGVWVGNEKITALGISIKNKVTMHGFAFNVSPNLTHFEWIIPCGITDKGQTSLEALLRRAGGAGQPTAGGAEAERGGADTSGRVAQPAPSMDHVKRQVAREFRRIYEFEPEETILPGPPEAPDLPAAETEPSGS